MIISKKNKCEYITESISSNSRFYLNIFFLNRKEVLENIVRKKVSKKRPVLRAFAKRLAVNLVSDQKLVEKVGADLKWSIPEKLELQGIRASSSIAYVQSAFICVEVNILSVDIKKILSQNAGSNKSSSSFLDTLFTIFPSSKTFIETQLVKLVSGKVIKMIPQVVREKLQDKLIAEVEIIALTDNEQGPFLLQTIQNLRGVEDNSINNNNPNTA